MIFATLSRFRPGHLVDPLPAWAVALCAAVLCVAVLLALVAWVIAGPPDPALTGSWRWLAGAHAMA